MCIVFCQHICLYTTYMPDAKEGRRGCRIPRTEVRVVALGISAWFSEKSLNEFYKPDTLILFSLTM